MKPVKLQNIDTCETNDQWDIRGDH